jgi:hypothetical protein
LTPGSRCCQLSKVVSQFVDGALPALQLLHLSLPVSVYKRVCVCVSCVCLM